MKKIILLWLLLSAHLTSAQEKMITHDGLINFEASVPLFEEIKAKNDTVTCILNPKNGTISSVAFIRDFHFKIALMEKHFNENYMESDEYPKATFKGIIEGFNINIIGTLPKEFNLKGTLKLHGKLKKINTIAFIRKVNGGLEIISNFNVKTEDFNIKIPQMLSMKMAETVSIKTYFLFR